MADLGRDPAEKHYETSKSGTLWIDSVQAEAPPAFRRLRLLRIVSMGSLDGDQDTLVHLITERVLAGDITDYIGSHLPDWIVGPADEPGPRDAKILSFARLWACRKFSRFYWGLVGVSMGAVRIEKGAVQDIDASRPTNQQRLCSAMLQDPRQPNKMQVHGVSLASSSQAATIQQTNQAPSTVSPRGRSVAIKLRGFVRFFNLRTGAFATVCLPLFRDHFAMDSRDQDMAMRLLRPFTGDIVEHSSSHHSQRSWPQLRALFINPFGTALINLRKVRAAVSYSPDGMWGRRLSFIVFAAYTEDGCHLHTGQNPTPFVPSRV
ncbi:hypothetical protein HU200_013891 [Digitaria exilis]|uniref:Uncharacterized protein n=1 Tax=Digitaria exilis TaxID=1010633 RepID=A0A835KJ99_9POAL|nr:hypothetical protein HU200_013891 [Digitaria exilis]